MSDRELLEWAARAYWQQELADEEVTLRYSEADQGILYLHADNQDHEGRDREFLWNSLYNGEDALKLAAKLYIHITISEHKRTVCRQGGLHRSLEDHGEDAFEATCRAITRAAAEIGKATAPAGEGG